MAKDRLNGTAKWKFLKKLPPTGRRGLKEVCGSVAQIGKDPLEEGNRPTRIGLGSPY